MSSRCLSTLAGRTHFASRSGNATRMKALNSNEKIYHLITSSKASHATHTRSNYVFTDIFNFFNFHSSKTKSACSRFIGLRNRCKQGGGTRCGSSISISLWSVEFFLLISSLRHCQIWYNHFVWQSHHRCLTSRPTSGWSTDERAFPHFFILSRCRRRHSFTLSFSMCDLRSARSFTHYYPLIKTRVGNPFGSACRGRWNGWESTEHIKIWCGLSKQAECSHPIRLIDIHLITEWK